MSDVDRIDLADEISGAGDASAALRHLRQAGISDRALLTPEGIGGALGLAPVEALRDGTFQFTEGARAAVIIGIHAGDELADLVAWRPEQPGRFRRRLGVATFAGEYTVREAAYFHRPLRLFETPLDWLRANCEGAAILDSVADIRADVEGVAAIEAASLAHGRAIARQLRETVRLRPPPITVPALAARTA